MPVYLSGGSAMYYYSDPLNIGRHVEEGSKKYEMDMPPSVKETIDAVREGRLPKGMGQ